MTIGLELAGVERTDARAQAEPLLERFGLGEFRRSWSWQLSGGMRHRAAFLRTVLMGKPAMLLDEPFGSLDGITRSFAQQWLLQVWEEVRSTVVLITHDVSEAVFLADRVYLMSPRPGRISQIFEIDLPRPRARSSCRRRRRSPRTSLGYAPPCARRRSERQPDERRGEVARRRSAQSSDERAAREPVGEQERAADHERDRELHLADLVRMSRRASGR